MNESNQFVFGTACFSMQAQWMFVVRLIEENLFKFDISIYGSTLALLLKPKAN